MSLLAGVLLLALAVLLGARSGNVADPVVGPIELGGETAPSTAWIRLLNLGLFPALTLLFIALDLALAAAK